MQPEIMNVLAADDDDMNLFILTKNLRASNFNPLEAVDGVEAWKHLIEKPDDIHFVLLDRMMPGMDGLEVTRKMREHPRLRFVPVIIQSGKVGADILNEAYVAGADHYLIKPFDDRVMLYMLNSVKNDVERFLNLEELLKSPPRLESSPTTLKLPSECNKIAASLAHDATDPMSVAIALSEIMLNAVEHGNLEIGSIQKNNLIQTGQWQNEIQNRLSQPELQSRNVTVHSEQAGTERVVVIKDDGKGFKHQNFTNFDVETLTKLSGRGINRALRGIKKLEFIGEGNKVCCTFDLQQ